MFWIYILRCGDESYYTGHTDNLEARLAQHQLGTFRTCYTYERRPVSVLFVQAFHSREEALAMERRIKGWSRAKKEALIRGDWSEVSRLSRSKNPSTSSGQTGPSTGSGQTG
jgi:putative endonuclease